MAEPTGTMGLTDELLKFFEELQEITAFFQEQGGLTPEFMEGIGMTLPVLDIMQTFKQQQFADGTLEIELQKLGLQQQQIDHAMQQIQFEQGPYWKWYETIYYPDMQATEKMQNQTARTQARSQSQIARENTMQAEEGTAQAKMATENARYQMLAAMGMGDTTRTSDGRNVRGSGYSYGYV